MPEQPRYQVFISSTSRDLKDERAAVQDAVLQLKHFPIGMELFPATGDEPWQLIQDVIRESDYYVLVIGGKYGSQTPEGISYTESEYDFAKSLNMRIIPFLHKEPGQLARDRTETSESDWSKLQAFRSKVEAHHCNYWLNADDLKTKVIVSLLHETNRHPQRGWVRFDGIDRDDLLRRLADLQQRYDTATAELLRLKDEAEKSSSAAGVISALNETITLTVQRGREQPERLDKHVSLCDLFAAIGPVMTTPVKRSLVERSVLRCLFDFGKLGLSEDRERPWTLVDESFSDFEVELLALKLVTVQLHTQSHSSSTMGPTIINPGTYAIAFWHLTTDGAAILSALRKRSRSTTATGTTPQANDAPQL
jgi:hypothetical protein